MRLEILITEFRSERFRVIPIEKNSGEELAKVLWYYGLLPSINEKKIICPFHGDVNPSMAIDLEKGFFYFFGCGLSGDAFKFVKEMEKIKGVADDLKILIKYQKILKSKKCNEIKIDLQKRQQKQKISKEAYYEAYNYYHCLKKVDWLNCQSEEEILCKDYMHKRGFTADTLKKAKAKITYNKSYPIIFPMIDNGKFKGWVCRTTTKAVEEKRKYLYNEGFSRATTLVGEYRNFDFVFVVEGYMDRLKFIQFGVKNVVAILGWKMSDKQIEKLKSQGIKKIISALDNDECGKKGTEYLKNYFEVFRFQYLKGVKDPGEMDKEKFQKMYNRTIQKFKKFQEEKNGTFRRN